MQAIKTKSSLLKYAVATKAPLFSTMRRAMLL